MIYLKTFEKFAELDIPHGGEFNYGDLDQSDIDKIKLYIEDLKKITKENNIKLFLSKEEGVQFMGIVCNGYFDDIERLLACGMGKDVSQWLPILLHESCHMDQFLEQIPEWTNNLGMNELDKWLGGDNNLDQSIIDKEIQTSVAVELDNEKRTVNKIKKWGFDNFINVEEYIQKSNAYVLFYPWMRKNRKWYTLGKEPYNNKEIVSRMPKDFNATYGILTPEIEAIYDKYL